MDDHQLARAETLELLFHGLQSHIQSKLSLGYSRIGGENGQKLTRAAFAVIVKLAGLTNDFERIFQDLEFASLSIPKAGDPTRNKAVLEVVNSVPGFEKIINHWITASKMR